jgi:hypothetical protein
MRRAPPNAAAAARDDMHLAFEKLWLKHAVISLFLSHATPSWLAVPIDGRDS